MKRKFQLEKEIFVVFHQKKEQNFNLRNFLTHELQRNEGIDDRIFPFDSMISCGV